jgi:hypothetical protein
MPDFDAIAAALAARYVAAAMTAPSGYDPIRVATGDLPGQMTPLPTVLLIPDNGKFEPGNGTRLGDQAWLARFYYNQIGDLERDMAALRKWLTVLVDQHLTAMQLGGLVVYVRTVSWRVVVLSYAGEKYSGLELGLAVRTSESWLPSA